MDGVYQPAGQRAEQGVQGVQSGVCAANPLENPDLVVVSEKLAVGTKRSATREEGIPTFPLPAKKRVTKKGKSRASEAEENEDKKVIDRWTDEEAVALISLCGEMNDEFNRNLKKQGVDMWAKLQARLLCLIPSFKKTPKACKNKFANLFTDYKEAKAKNNISGQGRHDCKYYESFDHWWSESGSVMKHVSATTNDCETHGAGEEEPPNYDGFPTTSKPTTSSTKGKFHDQALMLFSKMVDNSANMLHSFQSMTGLMERVDHQMDRLIEKL